MGFRVVRRTGWFRGFYYLMVPVDGLLALARQCARGFAARLEPIVMVGGSNGVSCRSEDRMVPRFLLFNGAGGRITGAGAPVSSRLRRSVRTYCDGRRFEWGFVSFGGPDGSEVSTI